MSIIGSPMSIIKSPPPATNEAAFVPVDVLSPGASVVVVSPEVLIDVPSLLSTDGVPATAAALAALRLCSFLLTLLVLQLDDDTSCCMKPSSLPLPDI